MANEVIKSDGRREAFDGEKIRLSIGAAAREAELPDERISGLVEQVSENAIQFATDKDEITTAELREYILNELDSKEPAVSGTWREYDRTRK